MEWRSRRFEERDLLVRPFAPEDHAALGVSPRDAEIGCYFGRPLEPVVSPDADAPDFAVVERGVVVGRVWFRPGARPFEIGYFLRPDAWGRGLATRSVRLVTEWLLGEGGEQQLDLCTHPDNTRSQAVAARAGFRLDGADEDYAEFKDGTRRALPFVRTRG